MSDLKIFLNAPSAPIYTNFDEGARSEKTHFFGRNFTEKTNLVDLKKVEKNVTNFSKIQLNKKMSKTREQLQTIIIHAPDTSADI